MFESKQRHAWPTTKPVGIRARYFALGAAAMLVGLTVHFLGVSFSANVRDVIGDALWATMLAANVSAILPEQGAWQRYLTALAICYAVELSQLWQLPALESARSTAIGRLVLGSGFDPRDFAAYALGIFAFIVLDQRLVTRLARVQRATAHR